MRSITFLCITAVVLYLVVALVYTLNLLMPEIKTWVDPEYIMTKIVTSEYVRTRHYDAFKLFGPGMWVMYTTDQNILEESYENHISYVPYATLSSMKFPKYLIEKVKNLNIDENEFAIGLYNGKDNINVDYMFGEYGTRTIYTNTK